MKTHLKSCPHIKESVKLCNDSNKNLEGPTIRSSSLEQQSVKRQKTQSQMTVIAKARWMLQQQADLNHDLLHLFLANQWPYNGINNPETIYFISKWVNADAEAPDCCQLSGSILWKAVGDSENIMETMAKGKLATGQCDGWKDVAKNSIRATLMTVENEVGMIWIVH